LRYALALSVAVLQALQQLDPAADTLQFNWPTGVTARVETEFRHEYSDGQEIVLTSLLQMTYRMRVLPHADGRVIQRDNQTYVGSLGDLEPGVAALLPLWVPTEIVSPGGRFLRIENAEQVQQNVIDLFDANASTELVQRVPVFKEYMRLMTSDAGLSAITEEHWYDVVHRWIGAPLVEGPLQSMGPQLIPIGQQAPSTVSTRMVGRTACSRSGTLRECAIFEITTQRDHDQLAYVAKALKDSGAGGLADAELLEEMKTEQVTLESSTMLPHEFTITRGLVTTAQENGQAIPKIDLERIRSVFSYVDEQ
jgi:hypothetical protein